jgi:hypothetical protein
VSTCLSGTKEKQTKKNKKKRSVLGPSISLIIRYTIRNGSSYGPNHLIFCRGHITKNNFFFFPFGENKIEKEKKMLYPQV